MPMYEYRCERCEERFEQLVPLRAEHQPAEERVVAQRTHASRYQRLRLSRAVELQINLSVLPPVAEAFADESGRS